MTVRLHIERIVVDRDIAGTIDQRDFGEALQAALARSLSSDTPTTQGRHARGGQTEKPLALGRHGALAERIADSLHISIPALQPVGKSGGGRP